VSIDSAVEPRASPSAEDFAALADGLPQLAWIAEADGYIFWYNKRWLDYTGMTLPKLAGWGWQAVHDPEILPAVLERWRASIATGRAFEMVFPIKGADGVFRPFLTRVHPIKDAAGRVVRWFGTNTDITEQQAAADALANEKGRLATLNRTADLVARELHLEKLVQTVTDAGVELTGAEFGAFFYNVLNERGESYTLYTISGVPRSHFEKFPMPRNTAVFDPTFKGTGTIRSDNITRDSRYGKSAPYHGMPQGHLPVRSYLAVPVVSRTGEVLGGLFFGHSATGVFTERHEALLVGIAAQASVGIDNARLYEKSQSELRERIAAEEHRQLLINELNHRVKNTLATVQSLVAQTLRNTTDPAAIRAVIDARLAALSDVHDLLTREHWSGTSIADVLRVALKPYEDGSKRLRIEGPFIAVSPKTALALAMALHELVTNALKYGALSKEGGNISMKWEQVGDRLRFCWEESGGPTVVPPSRRGFGSRMIERGLSAELGGSAQLEFDPGGLRCVIDAPLPKGREDLFVGKQN
jgi:PAS domain S-box-containing protein